MSRRVNDGIYVRKMSKVPACLQGEGLWPSAKAKLEAIYGDGTRTAFGGGTDRRSSSSAGRVTGRPGVKSVLYDHNQRTWAERSRDTDLAHGQEYHVFTPFRRGGDGRVSRGIGDTNNGLGGEFYDTRGKVARQQRRKPEHLKGTMLTARAHPARTAARAATAPPNTGAEEGSRSTQDCSLAARASLELSDKHAAYEPFWNRRCSVRQTSVRLPYAAYAKLLHAEHSLFADSRPPGLAVPHCHHPATHLRGLHSHSVGRSRHHPEQWVKASERVAEASHQLHHDRLFFTTFASKARKSTDVTTNQPPALALEKRRDNARELFVRLCAEPFRRRTVR